MIVLVLSYVNTYLGLGDSNLEAVVFSQQLVTFYGVLLLFQGGIEAGKEMGLGLDFGGGGKAGDGDGDGDSNSSNGAKSKQLDQMMNEGLREDEDMVDKVRWAAASYVALTSATHVLLLEENDASSSSEVLYSLGDSMNGRKNSSGSGGDSDSDDDGSKVKAAIDTVYKSKGGRVSVPDSHPCASLLPEDNRRCILLQQVQVVEIDGTSRRRCLMVGSNQLLAAFTKNDLKWLGSLGDYLSSTHAVIS